MLLFHVLFAVGFSLGLVGTWLEVACIGLGDEGMLVVDVTLKLLCRGPTVLVILTTRDLTLKRAAIKFGVFVQVTKTSKGPSAIGANLRGRGESARLGPG
jgi:hypothetical protein